MTVLRLAELSPDERRLIEALIAHVRDNRKATPPQNRGRLTVDADHSTGSTVPSQQEQTVDGPEHHDRTDRPAA